MQVKIDGRALTRTALVFAGSALLPVAAFADEYVRNGSFSLGNSSFGSDYQYKSPMIFNPGNYGIATGSGDHTTTSGNFVVVDGAFSASPLKRVWYETVNVPIDSTLTFSGWARSFNPGPIVTLEFLVDGVSVGTLNLNNPPNADWQKFSATVNTEKRTQLALSVINLQTNNSVPGNDFALDDLSLISSVPEIPAPETLAVGLAALFFLQHFRQKRNDA